jgi:hypothetical protein
MELGKAAQIDRGWTVFDSAARLEPQRGMVRKPDVFRTSDRQILPLQDQQLTAMLAKRFFERAQMNLQLPGPFLTTNGRASRHHSVLFFPSNHFRRSATPMLYAFPSFAAGSSLACKAFRICLSFVPMRMAASVTVTAMRSSNGDLDDIMWPWMAG